MSDECCCCVMRTKIEAYRRRDIKKGATLERLLRKIASLQAQLKAKKTVSR
jgi:hypothetical protein